LKEGKPMKRWQLKKKYLFVDAQVFQKPGNDDYTTATRVPASIPYAHVMDKMASPDNNGPAPSPYLALNPGAGFIARFIIQGVDTDDLLPQILVSEYGLTLQQAKDEVGKVLGMLNAYLRPRVYNRPHQDPAVEKQDVHATGQYDLDFRVNWFGAGVIKGPL
jgi:hypothetical protein